MTFDEFVTKWNGKLLDYDNTYGGQCVDVYRQYLKEVLEVPQSPPVVGAADIWTSYRKEDFNQIKNTPEGIPQKGDIVIWNKYASGGYGHVGIFKEGDANRFTSFDENWPIGSKCHLQEHNYTNVLGWLHSKKAVIDAVSVSKEDFERMLGKSNQWDELCAYLKFDNTKLDGAKIAIDRIEKLQGQISQTQKALSEVEAERNTFREERDKALSNVCPNPGVHLDNDSGDLTGSDTPSIILDNGNSSLPSDTPPDKQKNAFEKLIAFLLNWFK